jgi:hypothetical protein
VDVKLRMAPRHFRKHGSEMGRAERKRRSNPQAAAQLTGGEDRFPGHIDLGADSGRMVPERDPGFCESGAAGRSRKQLDAKLRFKPKEPPTDDRLGDAEPARGGRYAPGIGHFDECLYSSMSNFGVPDFATQLATNGTTASP